MIHNLASSKTIGVGDARMSLSYAQSHEYVVSMWINDLHVRDLTTHDNVNAALASARSIEMYYGIGGEGLAKVHIFNFAYSKPILRSVHGKWRDATPQEIRALNLTKRLIIARPFGQTSLGWIRVKAYAQLVIPKGVELTAQALANSSTNCFQLLPIAVFTLDNVILAARNNRDLCRNLAVTVT